MLSSTGWPIGLGCEEAGEAGETGSVMSLLLLQDEASEQMRDATPLYYFKKSHMYMDVENYYKRFN